MSYLVPTPKKNWQFDLTMALHFTIYAAYAHHSVSRVFSILPPMIAVFVASCYVTKKIWKFVDMMMTDWVYIECAPP